MSTDKFILGDAARTRWTHQFKARLRKAGKSQKEVAIELHDGAGLESEMSRFVNGTETVLRSWFSDVKRIEEIEEQLKVPHGTLHDDLLAARHDRTTPPWHPHLPEVAAQDVRIPPRMSREPEPLVDELVRSDATIYLVGPPGSGRHQATHHLFALLQERHPDSAGGAAHNRRIKSCHRAPPGTRDVVYMRPWRLEDVLKVVSRVRERLESPSARTHLTTLERRLRDGEDLIGGPWWPGSVAHAIVHTIAEGPPPDEATVRRRWLSGIWESARRRVPVLKRLPEDFLARLWATRWKDVASSQDWARLSREELDRLIMGLLPRSSGVDVEEALERLVSEGKKNARRALAEKIAEARPERMASAIAAALVREGLLVDVDGILEAESRSRALGWGARALGGDRDWLLARHRSLDPDLPELMANLAREGADPSPWLAALEAQPEGLTAAVPDAAIAVLANCDPASLVPSGGMVRLWARALLEQVAHPDDHRLRWLWQASLRLGSRLPSLVSPDPWGKVARLAGRELPSVPEVPVATLMALAPLQMVPTDLRALSPDLVDVMARGLPEEGWEALGQAAEQDAGARSLLSGEAAASSSVARDFWMKAPPTLRLRWFGEGCTPADVPWDLWPTLRQSLLMAAGPEGPAGIWEAIAERLCTLDSVTVEARLLGSLPLASDSMPDGFAEPLFPLEGVLAIARRMQSRPVLEALVALPRRWMEAARYRRDRLTTRWVLGPEQVWPWSSASRWRAEVPTPSAPPWEVWHGIDAVAEAAAEVLATLGDPRSLRRRQEETAEDLLGTDLAGDIGRMLMAEALSAQLDRPPAIASSTWQAQRVAWLEDLRRPPPRYHPMEKVLEAQSLLPLAEQTLGSEASWGSPDLWRLVSRHLTDSEHAPPILALAGIQALDPSTWTPEFEDWVHSLASVPSTAERLEEDLGLPERRRRARIGLAARADETVLSTLREELAGESSNVDHEVLRALPDRGWVTLASDAHGPQAEAVAWAALETHPGIKERLPGWYDELLDRCSEQVRLRLIARLRHHPDVASRLRDQAQWAVRLDERLYWAGALYALQVRHRLADKHLLEDVVAEYWQSELPLNDELAPVHPGDGALAVRSPGGAGGCCTGGVVTALSLLRDLHQLSPKGHAADRLKALARERLPALMRERGRSVGLAPPRGWLFEPALPPLLGVACARVLDALGLPSGREDVVDRWARGEDCSEWELEAHLRGWLAEATETELREKLRAASSPDAAWRLVGRLHERGELEARDVEDLLDRPEVVSALWRSLMSLLLAARPSAAMERLATALDAQDLGVEEVADLSRRLFEERHPESRALAEFLVRRASP